jgi:hypothetical protein
LFHSFLDPANQEQAWSARQHPLSPGINRLVEFPGNKHKCVTKIKHPSSNACSMTKQNFMIYPQSSFFQEDRAVALPSPTEIRARNEASGDIRANNLDCPTPVKFPSLGLVVKYGTDVTAAEIEAQVMMHERLQGQVPIPEIYGWAKDGDQRLLYMALIEGDTLQTRFNSLSESERQAICKKPRSMATRGMTLLHAFLYLRLAYENE